MINEETKNILAKIEDNLAHQNKFTMEITIPEIFTSNEIDNFNKLSYYIKNTSLPSSTAILQETKVLGKDKYTIIGSDTDNVIVTFYDTKKQIIRNLFIEYLDKITSHNKIDVLSYYPNQYQTEAKINIHESSWKLKNISPISVGDLVLDYFNDNSLSTFDVTFKVKSCTRT